MLCKGTLNQIEQIT